jgi:pteridine reductase
MSEGPLADKVALVTGGARRVGAQIARKLHAQGMKLVIHYRSSEQEAHRLQQELHDIRSESVMLVRGNLLRGPKLSQNLVYETIEAFGRVDVLINTSLRKPQHRI